MQTKMFYTIQVWLNSS